MPAPTVSVSFDSALGGGTTSTCTGPTTVAQGDLLIMLVGADDTQTALTGSTTGSPTWPSGWTEIQGGVNRSAGGDVSCHAAYKVAGAGDVASGTGVNYTLTWTAGAEGSAAFCRIPAGEFDATTPIDASSVTTTGAGATSIVLAGVTTTVADTLLIGYAVADESSAYVDYWSNPPITGWTAHVTGSAGQGGSNTYACVATTTQAAAGATGNKTATIRVENDAIAGFLIAVRPAAGGGPATFTTTVGTADAAGGSTSYLGGGTIASSEATATAEGGSAVFAGGSTFTTVAASATAEGGLSPFTRGTIGNKAALLGLADGTAITTSNSGNGGQTAFDAVVLSGGSTLTYTAATASMTATDTAGGGVARAEWTNRFAAWQVVVEAKLDGLPTSMGGGDCAIFEVRSASALIARVEIDDATGRVYVYGPTGGSVTDSGATVIGSGGARISLGVDVTGGALHPRLYLADDGESETAAWSTTVTGLSLGSSLASVLRIGQTNSTPTGVVHVEHVRVNDQQTAGLGPWTAAGTLTTTEGAATADGGTTVFAADATLTSSTGTADAAGDASTFSAGATGALTTVTGEATAEGAAGAFTAGAALTTTGADATADGGAATFAGAAVLTTVAGTADSDGGSSAFAATATLTTAAGDASADGGPSTWAAGGALATLVGTADATGGVGTFSAGGSGTIATTAGDATADGGQSSFTGGQVAGFTTLVGTADADGGTGQLAATATLLTLVGAADADGGQSTFAVAATFTTTAGDAAAAGGIADLTAAAVLVTLAAIADATGGTGVMLGVPWAPATRPRATIAPNLATAAVTPNRATARTLAVAARAEIE